MDAPARLLVTSALPYANGPIHLGHLAGAYLPADLYCRYQRLRGRDLVYICGSDEHGVPILLRARNEGVTPQEIVNQYHGMIKESFEAFGMSFDYYGRTSSPVHHDTSAAMFETVDAKGTFVLKSERQLFDPKAGMFLADRFVRGTCPVCGYDDAYGDQCENCGSSLSPSELINPRSAVTDATPVEKETTHWYLPLADFQPRLEAWIETHPEWKPNVLGQVHSWFNDGLRDRAMTRDLLWGVPVPASAAERAGVDVTGKVLYVWFDAPIGYISATREWAEQLGDPDRWKTYWQRDDTRLVHFIGKDNIVFHCLIFPATLMAHGDFVLPDNVPANEFLNIEGRKLSTSRNWAIWLHEYLETFPPDLLRYALATMLPESKDADFSWKEFQARVNSELADIFGNFINRTLTFVHRFFDGRVPPPADLKPIDREVLAELATFPDRIGQSYEAFRFREAVAETMALARLGNKYFNDTEPWHTRTSDPQACANTIHICLQLSAALSVLMDPIIPHSAETLRGILKLDSVRSSAPGGAAYGQIPAEIGWDEAGQPLLSDGHPIGEPHILFTKLDDDVIDAQIDKLGPLPAEDETKNKTDNNKEPAPRAFEPLKDAITYDDFNKLDLRVGQVLDAERVPKTDKLLRLQVDLGFEKRQILAGLAEHVEPDALIGLRVVVVANLAPRKIRGLESQGMLLAAEHPDGPLTPVSADLDPGSVVR